MSARKIRRSEPSVLSSVSSTCMSHRFRSDSLSPDADMMIAKRSFGTSSTTCRAVSTKRDVRNRTKNPVPATENGAADTPVSNTMG